MACCESTTDKQWPHSVCQLLDEGINELVVMRVRSFLKNRMKTFIQSAILGNITAASLMR